MPKVKDSRLDALVNNDQLDVRDLRTTLQLTVAQAAAALGVSPATIEAWESGRRNPKIELAALNEILKRQAACLKDSASPVFGRFDMSYVRMILGDTISEFGRKLGVSPHTARAFEQNRRIPTDAHIQKAEKLMKDAIAGLNAAAFNSKLER